MFVGEIASQLGDLVEKGAFGFGVFECVDIYATFEEWKSKSVEFMREPYEQAYSMEAIFKDDSGNWFALVRK